LKVPGVPDRGSGGKPDPVQFGDAPVEGRRPVHHSDQPGGRAAARFGSSTLILVLPK